MNFDSIITRDSKLPGYEGVKFTFRRLNRIERAKRDFGLIESRARLSALFEQMKELLGKDDLKATQQEDPADRAAAVEEALARISTEDRIAYAKADHEMGLIFDMNIKPATIRAGLVRVEGITFSGDGPLDIDAFLASAPDELIDEVWLSIESESGLTAEQAKNLLSATTLPASVDGRMNNTTAAPASGSVITDTATAPGSSPN